MLKERYAQELVEIDMEGFNESFLGPGPLVSLIDMAPQNHVVRTLQRVYSNLKDDSFLKCLFMHYRDRESQSLLRKASGNRQFILQHL